MKIAVNTRFLLKDKLEGIGWFTHETLSRIVKQHPEHEFIFLFDRPFDPSFVYADNVKPIKVFPPTRHPYLWYWWFEKRLPKILRKEKADHFLSQDGYLSLRSKVPTTLVIHDLAFEHYPHIHSSLVGNYCRKYTRKFAHRAERIVTVSNYTKQDIIKQYGVDEQKIDVVYNGMNSVYQPVSGERQEMVRQKYSSGCEYFVYVGSIHPRKNIGNLLQAYDQFRGTCDETIKMIIAGAKGWQTSETENIYRNMVYKEDVLFTGRVPTEELSEIVGSALALTYVPYFEGFGIPILEAMACDTPVITSNVTSMPEVAGDAALLVDPFSIDSISNAMTTIYKDQGLRNDLLTKGKNNIKRYSWDKSADDLWEALKKSF